jgi:hypothetical protein
MEKRFWPVAICMKSDFKLKKKKLNKVFMNKDSQLQGLRQVFQQGNELTYDYVKLFIYFFPI